MNNNSACIRKQIQEKKIVDTRDISRTLLTQKPFLTYQKQFKVTVKARFFFPNKSCLKH